MHNNKDTFEDIFNQNKNRIHYQMHKLGIHDPHNEFFTEGIYAIWKSYKRYQPNKGPMGTYFNYQIRYSLIDMLRKKTSELNNIDKATKTKETDLTNGNHYGTQKYPLPGKTDIDIHNDTFWKFIRSRLSANQWKWVQYYIIEGMSQAEIAVQENVSIDAVKSWAREARKKLREQEDILKNM